MDKPPTIIKDPNSSASKCLLAAASSSSSSSNYRWWSNLDMVAVVTGANKGIGFALVKRLAELGLTVVLTARDEKKGAEALESIKKHLQGLGLGLDHHHHHHHHLHFFCLDVADPDSIATFASWFNRTHGFLDILVNNAAVCFNDIHQNSLHKAHTVIATNFHGPKLLIEALFPMFRPSPSLSKTRILNITSRLGSLNKLTNLELRAAMEDVQHLSEDKILAMLDLFLSDVNPPDGRRQWNNHRGWPEVWTDYSVSKLALNAYSKLLATRYKLQNHGLSVNCFCPGFTQTSMTQGKGTHTPDHAAAIAATLVLLPPQDLPTGIFFLAPSTSPGLTILSNL